MLLGMSGGVDSSVSAALLLADGYEVIGAFMKNWSGGVEGPRSAKRDDVGNHFKECDWRAERRDAARVSARLGIPFLTFDFEEEYRRDVVDSMFREFEAGRTPNPDVMCNKHIKFDRFIQEADRLHCDFVATGHYARSKNGGLFTGIDQNKDQSYFLWAMNPAILPRVLFPVGEMEKIEVRATARELRLEVADKKDSTGICFIGEVNMRSFLQERIPCHPGKIVTVDGREIGAHEGLAFYTIGQREGLGIGGGAPYYIVEKRPQTNELVVASNYHPALFRRELTAQNLNWFEQIEAPYRCQARIRYRQPIQECVIVLRHEDQVQVVFDELQRAITPGQSIVFYDGDKVFGGGIIL